MLFLFGCSASLEKRMDNVDNRLLEKKIDDLSSTISLVVNDGNRLHNDLEEVKAFNKTIQEKIEGLEVTVRNLDERIESLTTSTKTKEIAQLPAEEKDVEPPILTIDSSKSSEVPESDIQKTINA